MISFMRSCSLRSIASKLLLLYFLNGLDIVFTLLLLRTGLYREANPFMSAVVQSPIDSLVLKLLVPALLLAYIFFRIKNATARQLKLSNYILGVIIAFYCLVNLSHIVWFILMPVFADSAAALMPQVY
jgi:hypothetical protein